MLTRAFATLRCAGNDPGLDRNPAPLQTPFATMKAHDIFCLVVRLSGYFFALFAGYMTLQMIIGPVSFGAKPFFYALMTALFGVAIIKLAPLIGAFAYPDDSVD